MSYVFPGDYWITLSLQNMGEWLTPVMKFFTWLGYPQAYMILIAIIYWSFDRKLGLRMAIFLPVVSSINSILKQAFHAPRPYWLDPAHKGDPGIQWIRYAFRSCAGCNSLVICEQLSEKQMVLDYGYHDHINGWIIQGLSWSSFLQPGSCRMVNWYCDGHLVYSL